MVQYIRNGKLETEAGIWNWKQSTRELKWNDKNWNAVRGLRDQSEFLEISDIVSEISEDGQNELRGAVGDQPWIGQGSQYLTTGRFTTTVVFNSIRKEDNLKNLEL